MKKLTRRHYLLGTAGVVAAAATGIVATDMHRWNRASVASHIEKVLRYLVRDEPMPDAVITRFAQDYTMRGLAFGNSIQASVFKLLSQLPYAAFRRLVIGVDGAGNVDAMESGLLTTFLLSTNYFSDDVAAGDSIAYQQFYDPYESGCQNPLATFVS